MRGFGLQANIPQLLGTISMTPMSIRLLNYDWREVSECRYKYALKLNSLPVVLSKFTSFLIVS